MKLNYHEVENYDFAATKLYTFIALLSSELLKESLSKPQKLHVNFMAKSVTLLKGIHTLWHSECFDECYVLQRCLSDRLFHLKDLVDKECYQEFEDFSFYKTYQSRQKLRSNSDFPEYRKLVNISAADNRKFQEISKNKVTYKRPKAEEIAKKLLDMPFLYDLGYDLTSGAVHPMFNDGEKELNLMLDPEYHLRMPDHRDILHNSLLYAHVIINTAMGAIGYQWRKPVIEFTDDLQAFLAGDKPCLESALAKMIKLANQGDDLYRAEVVT